MSRRTVLAVLALALVVAAAAGGVAYWRREKPIVVATERIYRRDLEALVSASGKIQPKRLVNVSADTPGRVVDLAVNEGDRVRKGQFLLQIDPKSLLTRVDSSTASVQAAELVLQQFRQATETARIQQQQAQQALGRQQELWNQQLTTRESLDRAAADLKAADSTLQERQRSADAQARRIAQERASLDSARYDLSKVRIVSPIDGVVTRRNIQEGETAMIGTMNNAGTVLLTLADMSIIQAEIEVDETSIPNVRTGQAAKITIDAMPDRTFRGHVTEIGNSPIQATTSATSTSATGAQATNFKVTVVLDEPVPDVRPGFTCTADISTAARTAAVAVPIQAVAVRELAYDTSGALIRTPRDPKRRTGDPAPPPGELKPGQTRRQTDGIFMARDGRATFVPIRIGIAGEKYFEVLSGLAENDHVITGPYNAVRGMVEGDRVREDTQQPR